MVIVLPFCVPAVVLAFARNEPDLGMARSFTLGEISFGFVAVAIAGVVRALTARVAGAHAFVVFALGVVALQTALAVSTDTIAPVAALERTASAAVDDKVPEPLAERVVAIGPALDRYRREDPTGAQWAASLVTGTGLLIVAFELIRRES